jgi:hypothetical protein
MNLGKITNWTTRLAEEIARCLSLVGRSAFKILLIESVLALFLPVVSANSKRYHAAAVKSKS